MRSPSHKQQPRGIARPRRAQRDALGRKLEIEEVDAHGGPLAAPRYPPNVALTILVGSAGGSPTAMRSTASMPAITRP